MLHAAHKELQGNLAVGNGKQSDGLEGDVARYVATICDPAGGLLKAAQQAKDFCLIVIAQPAIEELSNAVKLLLASRSGAESDPAVSGAQRVLNAAKKLPYLQSAVSFPDGSNQAPFPRFVVKE
jgi:hypothetical protein